jgi:hypothetical protein
MNPLTDDEINRIRKFNEIIQLFRDEDNKIPASYLAAFLMVAIDPNKGPTHYAQSMGTIQPVASRLLLEIGASARHKDQSLGLVDCRISATSLRDKEYYLTDKGLSLAKKISAIMAR